MSDEAVYRRLAEVLDSLPNGFPRTESGVELSLLKRVFDADEAELFCRLKLANETPREIAARTGLSADYLEEKLRAMWWKGQIQCDPSGPEHRYNLVPWIVGIYEYQLENMDQEFARLHVEYIKSAGLFFMRKKPQVMQVVPVEERIPDGTRALPYEQVSALIEKSRSFAVNQCICKKQMSLVGRECRMPREVCLVLSETPGFYDRHPMGGRVIDREEALSILKTAEEAGLVHMTANVRSGHWFLCNCCSCCCSQLLAARFGMKEAVNSHYYAEIDSTACRGCGTCAEQRCPVKAIEVEGGARTVNRDRCIGCGLCATTCPTGAIRLVHKNQDRISTPPADEKEWYRMKAAAEKKDISRFQ
ncbi:MAG: 4Fe-4S binding protein [Spirochaetes bacterium]|nr:4Fe-4S binding protein [Spirochaetota bacterium]